MGWKRYDVLAIRTKVSAPDINSTLPGVRFFRLYHVVPHSPVFSFLLPTNLVVAGSTKVCV